MSQFRVKWLSTVAYSGMFGFGIVMALLGAILPLFVNRPQFDLSKAAGLFLEMNAAMLVTTLLLGPALDRFGIRPAMLLAPVCVALAVALIANARSSGALTLGVILLGAGGGALNQATNTLVADLHDDPARKNAALNVLGVFFGFGALFIPFAMGALLHLLGIRTILYAAALLILAPAVLSALLRFPLARGTEPLSIAGVLRFLRQPLIWTFATLLFFESGNEFTLGGYISSYLTRQLGASLSMASYALAAYWGAMMLARAVLGRLLLVIRGEVLIRLAALGVALCLVVLISIHSFVIGAIVTALLGACIAAIFPTILGLAAARYASHAGTVFGILIGIGLVGGIAMPWVTGKFAALHNIRTALWIPAAAALAVFVLELQIESLLKKTEND